MALRSLSIAALVLPAVWGIGAYSFLPMLRIWHWPALPAALLIETAALALLLGWRWPRAAGAALAVNGLSLLASFLLYPLAAAILMEPVRLLSDAAGAGAMAVLYALVALAVALIDTAVEYPALRRLFGLAPSRRALGTVFGAKMLSAALLIGLVIYADRPARISDGEIAALEQAYAPELALMAQMLADMEAAGTPPWTDPAWQVRAQEAAQALRFQWLELRQTPGMRLTLIAMRGPALLLDARRKAPGRTLLRGGDTGNRRYRILLGEVDENGLGPHIAADLPAPDPE